MPSWLLWGLRKRQWGCEKCSVIPHEGLPKPKGVDEEDDIRIAARQDVMESASCGSSPQLLVLPQSDGHGSMEVAQPSLPGLFLAPVPIPFLNPSFSQR